MALDPRYRADCFEFYSNPQYTAHIDLAMPASTIGALEREAVRTGRTWSDQVLYAVQLCRGALRPDFDDRRSVEDWRTLLSPCTFRLREAEGWMPFPCLWRRDDEHQTIPQAC